MTKDGHGCLPNLSTKSRLDEHDINYHVHSGKITKNTSGLPQGTASSVVESISCINILSWTIRSF